MQASYILELRNSNFGTGIPTSGPESNFGTGPLRDWNSSSGPEFGLSNALGHHSVKCITAPINYSIVSLSKRCIAGMAKKRELARNLLDISASVKDA